MKKWNNPELLNLMVQETKTGMETPVESEQRGGGHKCYKYSDKGIPCGNNVADSPDTCVWGHENLKYEKKWWGTDLVACCVKDDVVFDS